MSLCSQIVFAQAFLLLFVGNGENANEEVFA